MSALEAGRPEFTAMGERVHRCAEPTTGRAAP